MNEHDLLLLAEGFAIGAYSMLLLHLGLDMRDDRRTRKQAAAAQKHIAKVRKETGL